jgi:ComF family protein
MKKLITNIKYSFVRDMAQELVSYIPFSGYQIAALKGNTHALLLPIPLHISRLRFRGFNQSDILGKQVASALSISYSAEILKRHVPTVAQVQMTSKEERLTNVHHAFSLSKRLQDREMQFVLFDDVFTTGATLREAANILKRNGARAVWGVTVAR